MEDDAEDALAAAPAVVDAATLPVPVALPPDEEGLVLAPAAPLLLPAVPDELLPVLPPLVDEVPPPEELFPAVVLVALLVVDVVVAPQFAQPAATRLS